MSSTKYTKETGDGYEGVFRVSTGSVEINATPLGVECGQTVRLTDGDGRRVRMTTEQPDEPLAEVSVNIDGYVTIPRSVVELLGLDNGDDVRVYNVDDGYEIVPADDDPRVMTDGGRERYGGLAPVAVDEHGSVVMMDGGGEIEVCPNCGGTNISRRTRGLHGSSTQESPEFYCRTCGADFHQPDKRPPEQTRDRRRGLAGQLADPDTELLTDGGVELVSDDDDPRLIGDGGWNRVRYGNETKTVGKNGKPVYVPRDNETCPDCGVNQGELHKDACDVEQCRKCGKQRLTCGCAKESERDEYWGDHRYSVEFELLGESFHWNQVRTADGAVAMASRIREEYPEATNVEVFDYVSRVCGEDNEKEIRTDGGVEHHPDGFHSGDHHVLTDPPRDEPVLDPAQWCFECGDKRVAHCGVCGMPLCHRHHETQAGYCSDRVTIETRIGPVPACVRPAVEGGLEFVAGHAEDYEPPEMASTSTGGSRLQRLVISGISGGVTLGIGYVVFEALHAHARTITINGEPFNPMPSGEAFLAVSAFFLVFAWLALHAPRKFTSSFRGGRGL